MSKVKCMRCDKCGELIIGDDPHGTFRGALWPSEIESFDLCRDCSVEVQRFTVPPKVVNVPLYYLSQSLGKMAECDAVYLCDGWENARGCKVERAAAAAYDLELIGYDLPCRGDAS